MGITIKLNGQELTIEAASHGEKFKQKHIIPDNINLDEMSSSFSSDGVLVVKAPKKYKIKNTSFLTLRPNIFLYIYIYTYVDCTVQYIIPLMNETFAICSYNIYSFFALI